MLTGTPSSHSATVEPQAAAPMFPVFALLKPHFSALDEYLHSQLAEFEPEIRELVAYCVDTSGKRIRPALVFLSGWRGGDAINHELVRLAAVVEMVHLATLVHDDIMDGAEVRRNRRTAARAFGANTAVLIGDALFSQALNVAAHFPTTEVCRLVSESTRRVCSGEIMQTLVRPDTPRDMRYYQRVIELKTAELFRVSCHLGAKLAGAGEAFADAAGVFGQHLGTGYQIFDDLADFFGDELKIGKTLGTDLASGKATLPLLRLLERLPADEGTALRREMTAGDITNIRRRVAQMAEFGIFDEVMKSIRTEIRAANEALAPWSAVPSVSLLRTMAEALAVQAEALKTP